MISMLYVGFLLSITRIFFVLLLIPLFLFFFLNFFDLHSLGYFALLAENDELAVMDGIYACL